MLRHRSTFACRTPYFALAILGSALAIQASPSQAQLLAKGAGGGAWLHSGVFHPTNDSTVLLGGELCGVFRSDNYGTSWYRWSDGLTNKDGGLSHYVEDMTAVNRAGNVTFFAATQGGIFEAPNNGSWTLLTEAENGFHYPSAGTNLVLPFSAIDWSGDDLLAAGAGTARYHSVPSVIDLGPVPTVWTLDLDGSHSNWVGVAQSVGWGSARAISTARLNRQGTPYDYIAVGTPTGIYLRDHTGSWVNISPPNYGTKLTCWSIHMTARGALYAAFDNLDTFPNGGFSGVKRIADVTSGSFDWQTVGNNTPLPPGLVPITQVAALVFLTVVDGVGSAPDLLYIGGRVLDGPRQGLYKCAVAPTDNPTQITWVHWIYQVNPPSQAIDLKYVKQDLSEHDLDTGWVDFFDSKMITNPIVSRSNPNRVIAVLNGTLHRYDTTNDEWMVTYTSLSGGGWQSAGWNELVVRSVDFDESGYVVTANADIGVMRAVNGSASAFAHLEPMVNSSASPTDDAAWAREAARARYQPNWKGTGPTLLAAFSEVTLDNVPAKMLMYRGGTWTNITAVLNSDRFLFEDFTFSNHDTVFVAYDLFNARVSGSAEEIEAGIYRLIYQGGDLHNWQAQKINSGLLYTAPNGDSWNAKPTALLQQAGTGRIVMVAALQTIPPTFVNGLQDTLHVPGAIYVLDNASDQSWTRVFGGTGTNWQDFQSLAQSADGRVMYAGMRGVSEGFGGVLKWATPASISDWTLISAGTPFGFEKPFNKTWPDSIVDYRSLDVRALAVHPWDNDIVFAGLHNVGSLDQEGLWQYDPWSNPQWRQLEIGTPLRGMGVSALGFAPTPGVPSPGSRNLLIGTLGQELYLKSVPAIVGADVSVAKTVDSGTKNEGSTVTYTITVGNDGPEPATGVTITDQLPSGLTYVSSNATQGTYNAGTGVWTIGSLARFASHTLTLVANVNLGTGGFGITNVARVTGVAQPDPVLPNNVSSAGISVLAPAPQQNTSGGFDDERPAWSADGSKIAFDTDRTGTVDLWTVNANLLDNNLTRITTTNLVDRHVDWAPHPTQFVYGAPQTGGGGFDLWRVPASGGSPTLLLAASGDEEFPSWSPDTTKIAYSNGGDIFVIPSGGGTPIPIVTDSANDTHPSWSPDGTKIAFVSDRSGNNDIWFVPSSGGTAVQVTNDPANDGAPDWSPDGTRIAFHSNRAGANNDIWIAGASAGGAVRQITSGNPNDSQPDWKFDSSRIAFARDGDIWSVVVGATGTAELALSKSVTDPTPRALDTIVYTVTVTNNGPESATVGVTDVLPSGVTFVSSFATQGSYATGTGVWAVGTMANGTTAVLTITATVNLQFGAPIIVNTASVTSSSWPDPSSANNTATAQIQLDPTGVPLGPDALSFALHPARPNPSKGRALLAFDLPVQGHARLSIYDVQGRLVRTLVDEALAAGRYAPAWDGRDATGKTVAPGIYFVRFASGEFAAAGKVVRLR
jgi:uncharacterized repeat protein (TIGR01451 family)